MNTAFELLPLIAFFTVYKLYGLMPATAILVILTLFSAAFSYYKSKQIPFSMIATALIVALFGGLTLWLNDERFIKMKPTIINIIFAAILLGGTLKGKGFLKHVMGKAIELEDAIWIKISRNYGLFFIILAILNEIVWRTMSTDAWVNFKIFGLILLTMLFSVIQIGPHIKKNA